jgi:hypothetical protein
VVFEPLDFLARLAALVPKPRVHLTRFHGVFAPHSALRAEITPAGRGKNTGITERSPAERHRAMRCAGEWCRVADSQFREKGAGLIFMNNGLTQTRSHDSQYRLTHLTLAGGTTLDQQVCTLDPAGNVEYLHDQLNGIALSYDGMGNPSSHGSGSGFTFNAARGLDAAEYFSFAPDGRALQLQQRNWMRVQSDWVWLDNLPVLQFQDSYDAARGGNLIGTPVTDVQPDHSGTPRIGTDSAGAIAWRDRSDAFGKAQLSGPHNVRRRLPGRSISASLAFSHSSAGGTAAAPTRLPSSPATLACSSSRRDMGNKVATPPRAGC